MVDERDQVRRILDTLRGTSRPLSITAISRQSGLDRHTASHILEILYVRGEILCLHQGMAKKYYLKEGSPRTLLSPASADLIIIVDQKWDLLYVNETAAEWMATPAKDLAGKKLDSLIHPVLHHPEFLSHLQEIRSQKVVRVTLTISREKGNLSYPVTITHIGFPDKNSGIIIIIENAFIDDGSQMPLRSGIIEQLSPGLVVADLQGEILHVNPSFLMSVRYPNESDILGRTITDILGGDPNLIETLINNGTYFSQFHDMILKRRDGSQVFCMMRWELVKSLSGIPFYISGIMLDMSGWGELKEKIVTLEERFRDIVERTSDVIWETGVDLCYTYVSPAITKMTGYLPGELTGTPSLWLLSYQGNGDETKKSFSKTSAAGSFITREHPLEHKDGHRVIVETRAIPLFSPAGKFRGYRGIDRDITERKRSEKALRESEEKYRAIFDDAVAGFFQTSKVGKLLNVNQSFARIFGYDNPGEIINAITNIGIQLYADPQDRMEVLLELEETGVLEFHESCVRHKDGHLFWILFNARSVRDADGTLLYYEGTIIDITDRKQAEAERGRLASIVDYSDEAIIGKTLDGIITSWNKGAKRIYGYSEQEMIGKNISLLVPPDHPDDTRTLLERIRNDESVIHYETLRKKKDGGQLSVLLTLSPVKDSHNRLIGVSTICYDITEQKQMEEKLRESEKKYRDIFNNAVLGIWQVSREGRFLSANDHAARILGYESAEDLIQSITDIDTQVYLDPKTREEAKRILLEKGVLENFQAPFRHKDGHTVWGLLNARLVRDADGTILYHEGTSQDITERKRANEQLRQSELLLSEIFNKANDAIFLLERTTVGPGRYLLVNDKAVRMLGYSKEELMEMSPRDIVPVDIQKKIMPEVVKKLLKDGHATFESVHRRKDGSVYPIEVSIHTFLYKGMDVDLSIIRDITDRKKAEEVLRENQNKYRAIFDDAVAGFFQTSKEGKLLNANKSFARIYGYDTPEEIIETITNVGLQLYADPQDRMEVLLELEETGVLEFHESCVRHKDGHLFWILFNARSVRHADGTLLYYEGTIIDITDRKKVEEALSESEEKYRILAEHVHDGIYIFKEDRLLYTNTRVSEITGYSPEELLAMPFTDHIHPDDLAFIKDIIKRIFKGESVPDFFECRIFRKDGMVRDIEFAVTTITYLGGLASLGVIRDITDRKQVEEALRASEEKFRLLINGSNDVFGILDPAGKIQYMSEPVVNSTGFQASEYEGRAALEFVHPDDRKETGAALEQVIGDHKKSLRIEFRVSRKDGGWVWVETLGTNHISHPAIHGIVLNIRNITDRKRVEEALRDSEEKLSSIIKYTGVGIAVIQDGRMVFNNSRLSEMMGFTDEEYANLDFLSPIHPDDRSRAVDLIRQGMAGVDLSMTQMRVLVKSGEIRWIEASAARMHWEGRPALQAFVIDITDRKKVEEALRESEEKYHLIFQSDPDALFLTELGGKGTVIDTNKAGLRMYGYSLDEVRRMRILDFSNEPEKTKASAVLPIGSVVAIPLRWHRKKDGTVFPVEISGCVFEMNGRGVILAIHRDITERKRAEEAIKSSLAEKEVLLREIHHRVKNNLAGIISLIDPHISSLTEPAQIYLLKDLETRIRSMALIHESLYGTQDLARVNVTTYTENLTRHLVTMFETATVVRCRIDMGNITLPIDTATPCGLVMNEIVTNSLKYAFPGTFSCEEIRGEPCTITVALHREGSDYLLTVADNGIGIPAEIDRDKTPSLGLFLIKFIVKHQLQGTLEVNTDNGTSYTIRFPEPETKERTTDEKR